MEERISQYLEKSRGSAGQLLDNNQIERCKIFALLITNIVNGLFPEHKLYNSLIRGLGDLQTGLKNGQIKEIANAFNLLDAILRTVRAPGFNYDLGPKVDRLLDELKV
jgi:hypothetical protein